MKNEMNKQTPEQKALSTFGMEKCVRAYELNVKQGEGGTVIEIETGIPKRSQGVAIRAGQNLLKAMATKTQPA